MIAIDEEQKNKVRGTNVNDASKNSAITYEEMSKQKERIYHLDSYRSAKIPDTEEEILAFLNKN